MDIASTSSAKPQFDREVVGSTTPERTVPIVRTGRLIDSRSHFVDQALTFSFGREIARLDVQLKGVCFYATLSPQKRPRTETGISVARRSDQRRCLEAISFIAVEQELLITAFAQACALRSPLYGSMSEIGIFRQLSIRKWARARQTRPCNQRPITIMVLPISQVSTGAAIIAQQRRTPKLLTRASTEMNRISGTREPIRPIWHTNDVTNQYVARCWYKTTSVSRPGSPISEPAAMPWPM